MARTREFQALLYACEQEGCPLCRVVQESVHRYLDAWKYELFTDVGVREELRRTQGFCHAHTWQLAKMGATLQLAQAYRDVLSDAIEQLQRGQVSDGPPASGGLLRRLFDTRRERGEGEDCPACRQQKKNEERYVDAFRQAIGDEAFYGRFADSHGLCLEHYRLVCARATDGSGAAWMAMLRNAQLACLQRLDEQLGELIRKHDYRFSGEAKGQEMHSWKRVAGFVAGEERHT